MSCPRPGKHCLFAEGSKYLKGIMALFTHCAACDYISKTDDEHDEHFRGAHIAAWRTW